MLQYFIQFQKTKDQIFFPIIASFYNVHCARSLPVGIHENDRSINTGVARETKDFGKLPPALLSGTNGPIKNQHNAMLILKVTMSDIVANNPGEKILARTPH